MTHTIAEKLAQKIEGSLAYWGTRGAIDIRLKDTEATHIVSVLRQKEQLEYEIQCLRLGLQEIANTEPLIAGAAWHLREHARATLKYSGRETPALTSPKAQGDTPPLTGGHGETAA